MKEIVLPVAAVAAGIVSATSPCVLPVIPGYLAAVTTTDARTASESFSPSIGGALGFVGGFTIVFTILGATASAIGELVFSRLDIALKVSGALLIILGLQTVGVLKLAVLTGERRLLPTHTIGVGPRRSILLGAVFALGWTPCIGPILATILTKAAADASLTEGVVLLLLYSVGLGLPFVALAISMERSKRTRRWLARRSVSLQRLGGVVMTAVGLGYLTGVWSTVFTSVQGWLARTGWPPI